MSESSNVESEGPALDSSLLYSDAVRPEVTYVNRYETTTPINVATEAVMCYVLGPISGFTCLVVEVKNDYVRFHAWQSSLVFTILFIIHLLLFWSKFLSRLLFLLDFGLMAFLMYHAWHGANDLTCVRIPIIGDYAARFVEEENE